MKRIFETLVIWLLIKPLEFGPLLFYSLYCPLFADIFVGYKSEGLSGGVQGAGIGVTLWLVNYFWMTKLLRWSSRFERASTVPDQAHRGNRVSGCVFGALISAQVINVAVVLLVFLPVKEIYLRHHQHDQPATTTGYTPNGR